MRELDFLFLRGIIDEAVREGAGGGDGYAGFSRKGV